MRTLLCAVLLLVAGAAEALDERITEAGVMRCFEENWGSIKLSVWPRKATPADAWALLYICGAVDAERNKRRKIREAWK